MHIQFYKIHRLTQRILQNKSNMNQTGPQLSQPYNQNQADEESQIILKLMECASNIQLANNKYLDKKNQIKKHKKLMPKINRIIREKQQHIKNIQQQCQQLQTTCYYYGQRLINLQEKIKSTKQIVDSKILRQISSKEIQTNHLANNKDTNTIILAKLIGLSCKFIPYLLTIGQLLKIKYQTNHLNIKKKFTDPVCIKISNTHPLPSTGRYHFKFKVSSDSNPIFLVGITNSRDDFDPAVTHIYLSSKNMAIQHNGVMRQHCQGLFTQNCQIMFVIDMDRSLFFIVNDNFLIGHTDFIQLQSQYIYLFFALELNHTTLILPHQK